MKKHFIHLAILSMTMILFGFSPNTQKEAKTIYFNQVNSIQAPAQFIEGAQQNPRLNKFLVFGKRNRIAARKGFKLYQYGKATVLIKDADNNLGSKLKAKASGINVGFVFIRFACACKLGGGTGGCMVKIDQDLNTVCESAGCSQCGVGIEAWGPDGKEIVDFLNPL